MKNLLIILTVVSMLSCGGPATTPAPTKQPNITKGDTSSYYYINGTKKLAFLEQEIFEGNNLLSIRDVNSSTDFTSFTLILKNVPASQTSFPLTNTTTKITESVAYVSFQITKDGTSTIYNVDSVKPAFLYVSIDTKGRKVFTLNSQTLTNLVNNFKDTVAISCKLVLLEQ